MKKKYNTPHRCHVVKTRMTEEEYADFTERLKHYDMSQAEFIRQAITRATMYHTSDRRRTMVRMLAALPDMDTEVRLLANGTIAKLEHMTDANFDGQRFDFAGE